jgi:hypothetical protein
MPICIMVEIIQVGDTVSLATKPFSKNPTQAEDQLSDRVNELLVGLGENMQAQTILHGTGKAINEAVDKLMMARRTAAEQEPPKP